MKLLFENWRGYLNEIGDGSIESYDYGLEEASKGEVTYEFETDAEFKYEVVFDRSRVGGWHIIFTADDQTTETGEGQPLKIMSTVVEIIKDFISRPDLNKNVRTYTFEGVPKWGAHQNSFITTTRTKLYMRYLKKHIPEGTEITEWNNEIRFILPEDKEDK